jgi:hypothetical protein
MTGAKKFFLSITVLAIFLPSGFSQQSLNVPSEKRSVLVNVIDAHGNAIRDLTKENFHVRVNGKPVVVLDARYSLAPRRIVLLLDMSVSMTVDTESGQWRIAREAADDLLAETPAEVPIAMLTFSRKVGDVFDFSQGRAAIAKWLREGPGQRSKLQGLRGTALFDAILEGLKLLQPVQPGDAVYAITDGGDNASHALADQTKLALLQSDVRLFAFLFAGDESVSVEQENRLFFLSMVADTGGFVIPVSPPAVGGESSWLYGGVYKDNPEKIRFFTQRLNIQVNGFWTLELAAPPSNKASKVKLTVVGEEGKIRKDVGVNYRRVLPATR